MEKCPVTYIVSGSSYLQLLPEGRRLRFRIAMEDANPFLMEGKRFSSLDDSLINERSGWLRGFSNKKTYMKWTQNYITLNI